MNHYDQEDDDQDEVVSKDEPVIGFASALAWLVGMTIVIAILSEYVVGTIEVLFFPNSLILYIKTPQALRSLDSEHIHGLT